MGTFLFVYRPAKDYQPDADTQARWMAWFEELGSSIRERGNPIFNRRSVGEVGSATQLGGYSLISAYDLAAAVALANGCPALAHGGGIEVGEVTFLAPGLAGDGVDAISAT